jgi:hypothetical protein
MPGLRTSSQPAEALLTVVLLSLAPERRALRACSPQVEVIVSLWLRVRQEARIGHYRWRMNFWSPWVGYRTIRRAGSLSLRAYVAAMDEMAPGVFNASRFSDGGSFEVHGNSTPEIMYKMHVGRLGWQPEMAVLRGNLAYVPL